MPPRLRRLAFAAHEGLKGKPTLAWLRRLEASQWLPREALVDLQLQGLRRLLRRAYQTAPYYRRVLDGLGAEPEDIRSLEDLRRLPCLTREHLREQADDLQARPRPPRTQRISTGGSTGSPATVLVTMEAHGFAEGARLRAHRWFGLEPGDREVVLWGASIELGRQSLWRELRDRLLNTRLLSAFELGEPALARHARTLERLRPAKLYGYASALALLAAHCRRTGHEVGPGWPRAVFTTAEPLYPFQRVVIREAFGCPVAAEYGARDAGLIAHECPEGRLHVNAEGMIVEIDEGHPGDEPESGEIVVTNLLSDALPLVRYRTGDVARREPAACPCGRGLPVLGAVEGRQTDFLVTPDGRVMHALAVIYVLREIPGIREFQVVQDRVDQVAVSVVPAAGFPDEARDRITARLRGLLGAGVAVEVTSVPHIERPPSGKHRHVISRAARERLGAAVAP